MSALIFKIINKIYSFCIRYKKITETNKKTKKITKNYASKQTKNGKENGMNNKTFFFVRSIRMHGVCIPIHRITESEDNEFRL